MTKISKEEARKIAHLSYISVNEEVLNELIPQLESVLSYAVCVKEIEGKTQQIDTNLVENRVRKDEVNIIVDAQSLLQEVPTREGSLIVVPMILEHI